MYSIYDKQIKRLMSVGRNSATKEDAKYDTEGLVEALSAACLLFIWPADPFAAAFDRPDVSDELLKQVQLFAKLPNAFPGQSRPQRPFDFACSIWNMPAIRHFAGSPGTKALR